MTSTEPARVTVVTAPACHFCEDAKAVLADLASESPLTARFVEAASEAGQELLARHGAGIFPLVLVDGEFFSAGRLPRRKLARLLIGRAAEPAGIA